MMRASGGGRSNCLGKSIQSSLEVIVTSSWPPLPHTYTIMVHYSWMHQQFWCRNCGARGQGVGPNHLIARPTRSSLAHPIPGRWEGLCIRTQGWQPLQLSFLLHRLQQHCVWPQVHKHCLEDRSKRWGHQKCIMHISTKFIMIRSASLCGHTIWWIQQSTHTNHITGLFESHLDWKLQPTV